ncbi:alpha-hydroxy-acid oxidizing protein [Gluconobacter sphaericus]|nr:alpha-hydroxy-acid oxidizing protein [Gluconobacter sphaericus]MBS1087014.1 alpha-hydroxy-acid oxidizing protein [Gluconobacter sphaericus]MBS1098607.1 alpha-hydroxy-acid oxidizing protein [Gluconobacter sphaericus]GBR55822.1 hypothetical protein AA12467_2292 [Gluconobacter sphaericus NBRC 12467]
MEGTPSIQRRLPLIPYRLLQMTPDMTMIADSSISQRSDIFKMLALGADAVMIGRLPLYGLAVMEATGVEHILHMLLEE